MIFARIASAFSLLHLALGDELGEGFLDLLLAARGKFLGDVAEHDLVAVSDRECLRDAGTHRSRADNANFHFSYLHM